MAEVVVTTRYGPVAGRKEDDLVVFRGIPFATAPLGPLRFRAPQAPEPWSGVRSATEFAPMSVQPPPGAMESIPEDPTEQSEDCLYLNVWTPACDDGLRPVMVWVHGGGFTGGATSSALYTGEWLARRGAVVVSLGYRLGALGLLGHPVFADPACPEAGFANWALQDQLSGLAWTRAHASAFGGDPRNITVFGESAGAISVASLLGSPASSGLFQRAILESGNAGAVGPGSAVKVAERLAGLLGFGGAVTREAFERVPVSELLAAQQEISRSYENARLPFQPVVDGGVLPRHPAAAIASGSSQNVDVIVGSNRDEWRFWSVSNPALRDLDDDGLVKVVDRFVNAALPNRGLDAAQLVDVFRSERAHRQQAVSPSDVFCAIASDWVFRVPSLRIADAQAQLGSRSFSYLFDWESPFGGGVLGSCHALELPFVFGSLRNDAVSRFAGSGEAASLLSDQIQAAWVSFARSGDPSCPELGEWPPYAPESRVTMRLGEVTGVIEAPMEVERMVLDKALGAFGEIETQGLEAVTCAAAGGAGAGATM